MTKPYIQQAIKERIEQLHNERSADAQEIIEYLTSVMRGESESEELVNEFIGDGCSRPTRVKKAPSEKDRIKAAERLGKRFGLFKDKVELDGSVKTDMATLAGVLDQLKGEDSAE